MHTGDYDLPADTIIVSRDWYGGEPAEGANSICYVNAFQPQPDDPDVDRPDETSSWPAELVLSKLAEDPNWTGEYLLNLSTEPLCEQAAERVAEMVSTRAGNCVDAVEFDNLDSWNRCEDMPSVQAFVPSTAPTLSHIPPSSPLMRMGAASRSDIRTPWM